LKTIRLIPGKLTRLFYNDETILYFAIDSSFDQDIFWCTVFVN